VTTGLEEPGQRFKRELQVALSDYVKNVEHLNLIRHRRTVGDDAAPIVSSLFSQDSVFYTFVYAIIWGRSEPFVDLLQQIPADLRTRLDEIRRDFGDLSLVLAEGIELYSYGVRGTWSNTVAHPQYRPSDGRLLMHLRINHDLNVRYVATDFVQDFVRLAGMILNDCTTCLMYTESRQLFLDPTQLDEVKVATELAERQLASLSELVARLANVPSDAPQTVV
jgi:hypothetical protein